MEIVPIFSKQSWQKGLGEVDDYDSFVAQNTPANNSTESNEEYDGNENFYKKVSSTCDGSFS